VSHTNKSGSNSTWLHESAESSRKRKEKVSYNIKQGQGGRGKVSALNASVAVKVVKVKG
jgi:hypothetical protein